MMRLHSWRAVTRDALALRQSRITLWHSVFFTLNIGGPMLLGWLMGDVRLGPLGGVIGLLFSISDNESRLRERLLLLGRASLAILIFGFLGARLGGESVLFWIALMVLTFGAGWYSLSGNPGASPLRYGALALVSAAAAASTLGVSALVILGFATAISALTRTLGHLYFPETVTVLPIPALRERPDNWISLRFCLIYAGAVALGLVLGHWQGAHRPLWVATTVLLVMQPDRQSSLQRILQRVFGTCVGVAVAALVVRTLHSESLLALAVLAIAFVLPHGSTRNYWLHSAFSAGLILVMTDFAVAGRDFDSHLLTERIRDVLLGCAVVLISTIFAFPPSFKRAEVGESSVTDSNSAQVELESIGKL
jgi:hypothetical protein